jgi:hypothetical protein
MKTSLFIACPVGHRSLRFDVRSLRFNVPRTLRHLKGSVKPRRRAERIKETVLVMMMKMIILTRL